MKILLAVDGSDYTRKMLDYVTSHNALFDASHEYTLFTAQVPLPHPAIAVAGSGSKGYHEQEAQKVLPPAIAALQATGLRVKSAWKTGPAGQAIGEFAQDGGYGLLIMGSHGHGTLARLVMGSVANQVLSHCNVPVLLIR